MAVQEDLLKLVRNADTLNAQRDVAVQIRGHCEIDSARKKILAQENGLAAAVEAFLSWTDSEAKEDCTYAMARIASEGAEMQNALVERGVLEPLVEFIPHIDLDGDSCASWALCELIKNNKEAARQLRNVPGVMKKLEAVKGIDTGDYAENVLTVLRPLLPPGRTTKRA